MLCNEEFNEFHSNISLDQGRVDRINNAMRDLDEFLKIEFEKNPEQFGIKDIFIEDFIQGSMALNTPIKPADNAEEFDLDVVLSLNLKSDDGKYPSAKEVVDWLADTIRKNEAFSERIKTKTRCVRIEYKGDFHMDIVPMTPIDDPNGVLLIPDKEKGIEGVWYNTHPKAYKNWFEEQNISSSDKLKKIVKSLKWWRKAVAPESADVTSVILTTIIGKYFKDFYDIPITLVESMENINDWINGFESVPIISNPGYEEENYADKWEKKKFQSFKRHFNKAAVTARAALDASDYNESINLWREIFGNKFPKLKEESVKRSPMGSYKKPSSIPHKRVNREFGY